MKQNVGTADRIIRAIFGVAALLVAIFITSGVWTILLYVISAILLVTALIGICPLYMLLHLSTKKK
jgi:hypothetical protein